MKKLIILVLVIVLGIVTYTIFFSNTTSYDYYVYKNTNIGYEFEIPQSWKTYEENSTVYIFPQIPNGSSIDQLYKLNQQGMTVKAITPASKDKLDEFYSKVYKNSTSESFSNQSPFIVEIKSTTIPPVEIDDPAYGFIGIEYAIKTNKRIYSINSFYKDSSDSAMQRDRIIRIVETLAE